GFIGMGTVHQAFAGHTPQHPGQLWNLGNIRLTVERYFFHIQAAGQPRRGNRTARDGHALWIVAFDQGMVIGHEEKGVDIGLLASTDGGTNRASIITQMWNTGCGNTGQYSCRHDKKYAYKTTCQGQESGARARAAPHSYKITAWRRSDSRYSRDCISINRETVRWNSLAMGPSTYNCSSGTAADIINLTLWS